MTKPIEKLLKQITTVTDKFAPGLCNELVKQDVTFTVPDLFAMKDALQEVLNSDSDYFESKYPRSGWYTSVAEYIDICKIPFDEIVKLHEKLKLQTTFCGMMTKPSALFKVYDGVRYNVDIQNHIAGIATNIILEEKEEPNASV